MPPRSRHSRRGRKQPRIPAYVWGYIILIGLMVITMAVGITAHSYGKPSLANWSLVSSIAVFVILMFYIGYQLLFAVEEGVQDLHRAGVFREIAKEARRRNDNDPLGIRRR